jgi:hypothetical protein
MRRDPFVERAALVEHPHDRELFHPQVPLLAHQLVAPGHQPFRRPAPPLIEMLGHVEHALIQPRGCDIYTGLIRLRRKIPE